MNAVSHAGAPTRTATVLVAPTAFLNAEVLAWRSARVAFRSPALTFSVPTFQLPNLHTWQGPGGIGAALERRAGMAEMCVSHPNGWLVPWFPQGLIRVPKMGAPLTHPLPREAPGIG